MTQNWVLVPTKKALPLVLNPLTPATHRPIYLTSQPKFNRSLCKKIKVSNNLRDLWNQVLRPKIKWRQCRVNTSRHLVMVPWLSQSRKQIKPKTATPPQPPPPRAKRRKTKIKRKAKQTNKTKLWHKVGSSLGMGHQLMTSRLTLSVQVMGLHKWAFKTNNSW